eukprot:gene122-biopygen21051
MLPDVPVEQEPEAGRCWTFTLCLRGSSPEPSIVPAAGCAEQARAPERARHVADVGLLGSPIILPANVGTAGFAHQCASRQGSPTSLMGGRGGSADCRYRPPTVPHGRVRPPNVHYGRVRPPA